VPETFFQLPTAPKVTHPETKAATRIDVVETGRDLEAFLDVPSFVYWGDPFYVAPLRKQERARFDRAKNPFFEHGAARLFTAWHGHGRPVARIAAFIDRRRNEKTGKKQGFFGCLEFLSDARLPEALLGEACRWLRAEGAEEILGPVAFPPAPGPSGLLVDGFHDDPVYDAPYNPPSYAGFLVRLGLETAYDVFGYEVETTAPAPDALAAKAKAAAAEGLIARPSTERPDLDPIAARVRSIFPGGSIVLEAQGKPAGRALATADYNRVLKHLNGGWYPFGWLRAMILERTVDRVAWDAVLLDPGAPAAGRDVLAHALWDAVYRAGFRSAHVSVPADAKDEVAFYQGLGAKRTRAWRVYRVPVVFPDGSAQTPSRG
jgi:hypothetical protein